MKERIVLSAILVIIVNLLAAGSAGAVTGATESVEINKSEQGDVGKPTKEEVIQKTQTLRMPFIVNNGQVDERVSFYAKTSLYCRNARANL